MTLKELGTLWGNPIIKLREYAKKYRICSLLLYALDVVVLSILTALMYRQGSSFHVYMFIIVMFVILFSLVFNLYLNTNKWSAFKFYRRYRSAQVTIKKYKVDASNLYSVIYCMNYRRLKQDKELSDYLDMIINACNEDWVYAKTFMKYLSKYEDPEAGNLELYVITRNKKDIFVEYVDNINNKDNAEVEKDADIDEGNN